jgi:hydrogenase maturation protein HypF
MDHVAQSPGVPAGPPLRRRIIASGVVQGVGFRPLLYRRATELGLAGWVSNAADGLVVEVEGAADAVERFVAGFHDGLPRHARIDTLEARAVPLTGERCFGIAPSPPAGTDAIALPDIATCERCLAEIRDPANRRHRYPFTTCVDCGPRYSILDAPPYDRCRTSMAAFDMCPLCRAEYEDPADRRFHAQANACPACGPALSWLDGGLESRATGEGALQAALAALREGCIVAVKGIGGFQLMADAGSEPAVGALRGRKRRPDKPFAVLARDLDMALALCEIEPAEAALLGAAEAPIVLLRRRYGAPVAAAVAPGNPWLGVMLPCSPLHHLLADGMGSPLVATSGNLAGEPLLHDDDAPRRLLGIADAFLVHDRPILHPVDDSVARVAAGRPMLLRRARGYAAGSVAVAGVTPGIVGTGGHLKNTVAVSLEGRVLVGPHVGDLDGAEARRAHRRCFAELARAAGAGAAVAIARDLHPDFAATTAAGEARSIPVPHHVAHVAACIAEHGLRGPVLGVAWDGSGYGPDGTLWGGEFLLLDGGRWRRLARLRGFRLPGGERAMREPWRPALGALAEAGVTAAAAERHLPQLGGLPPGSVAILAQALQAGINAPVTSSAGRLFDAAAALLGLCDVASYEGQAAMALEWAAESVPPAAGYAFPLERAGGIGTDPATVDFVPALRDLLRDRAAGVPVPVIARRWHDGLAAAVLAVAKTSGAVQVALAGGCFQNRVLLERVVELLGRAGLHASWPQKFPPNDGGLSLGQVAWAARAAAEPA